jgi:hypothetical protein
MNGVIGWQASPSNVTRDTVTASGGSLSVTAAQVSALGATTIDSANSVTLADTGAHIAAVSSFATFAAHGVDTIDATDNVLSISLAQFNALGAVTLTLADTVTLADTGATIGGLSTGTIDALATAGIDAFDATNNAVTLSVAQFNRIVTDHIALASGDAVTISDTAANLATLTFSTLAAAGVDFLDSTDAYTLTAAQMTALGTAAFTSASNVTVADTGPHIGAVSDFASFAAHGVDTIDATDNALALSVAQFNRLVSDHVALTAGDAVTISDTAANLATLTFSTLAAANVDYLNSTDAYTLTVAQMNSLGVVTFTPGSSVTVVDTPRTSRRFRISRPLPRAASTRSMRATIR